MADNTTRRNTMATGQRDPWEPSTTHAVANGGTNGRVDFGASRPSSTSIHNETDPERDPAAITAYTVAITATLTFCTQYTISTLLYTSSPTWRLPFFLASLALFHLLEYYTTAKFNPEVATTKAFLLNNGKAYNIAHCLAFLECGLHLYFSDHWLDQQLWKWATGLGLALMVIGQGVRTAAMVTAGSNFNHIVQSEKKRGHVLITDGVYAWLRHPSYFGFFWWGLGTQLVLGNVVCFAGYAVVLWRFFSRRIISEERYLIGFFGDEYSHYRQRTKVGIPLIP